MESEARSRVPVFGKDETSRLRASLILKPPPRMPIDHKRPTPSRRQHIPCNRRRTIDQLLDSMLPVRVDPHKMQKNQCAREHLCDNFDTKRVLYKFFCILWGSTLTG